MPEHIDVLRNVTSPLALAALALLVVSGVARAIVSQRGRSKKGSGASEPATHRSQRLLIHWGFVTAVLLGVMANVSVLAAPILAGEVRVSGSVFDTGGRPIANATVDFIGVRRTLTQDTGEFEFSIPRSRSRTTYKLNVFCPGYESVAMDVAGPAPEPLAVRLSPITISFSSVIGDLQSVGVGHYLGLPLVVVEATFRNPTSLRAQLSSMSVSITNGSASRTLQPMMMWLSPGLPPVPFLQPWPIDPGAEWHGYWAYCINDAATDSAVRGARAYGASHGSLDGLDTAPITSAFERNFIWTPGTWQLRFSFAIDSTRLQSTYSFDLSPQSVGVFKSSSKRLKEPDVLFIEALVATRPIDCILDVNLAINPPK